MNLQERIDILSALGNYMQGKDEVWNDIKDTAVRQNAWFTNESVELSAKNIAEQFLQKDKLQNWAQQYHVTNEQLTKTVGIVMAGNIPLVGFHDFLCVLISGYKPVIKASSKDEILIKHLVAKLAEFNSKINNIVSFGEHLKGCDIYIATGSNNSSRYFEYYFGKYPNIIRRNRTSVAVLTGNEINEEIAALADDMQLYFGLGCRNVTKLYVPQQYDFIPLITALKKYDDYLEFHKYKHNFDYHLALLMMANKKYMNSGAVIFSEDESLFSPVSRINYEYYNNIDEVTTSLKDNTDVQCIVGNGFTPFGKAQQPTLNDYADGIDTMKFLNTL